MISSGDFEVVTRKRAKVGFELVLGLSFGAFITQTRAKMHLFKERNPVCSPLSQKLLFTILKVFQKHSTDPKNPVCCPISQKLLFTILKVFQKLSTDPKNVLYLRHNFFIFI